MAKYVILFLLLLSTTDLIAREQKAWLEDVTVGGRLQGVFLKDSQNQGQDLYLRRARVNLEYRPAPGHRFNYDVRNDSSNREDRGEGRFVLGDAFWTIDINRYGIDNLRFFRAKVDVSHTQTSSSKNLLNPERAEISGHASNFVVHNRRAVNAQINGHLGHLSYHFAVADGVHKDELTDLSGRTVDSVVNQNLTYGGKLRYYFLGDVKEHDVQDMLYERTQVFSLGVAYFTNDRINIDNRTNGIAQFNLKRELTNVELSYSNHHIRILAEYFHFAGDLLDLSTNDTRTMIGSSQGYYAQAHYFFNRWAPYIIYESFDRNKKADNFTEKRYALGINYFEHNEQKRYGLTYKKIIPDSQLVERRSEQLYAYVMLDF